MAHQQHSPGFALTALYITDSQLKHDLLSVNAQVDTTAERRNTGLKRRTQINPGKLFPLSALSAAGCGILTSGGHVAAAAIINRHRHIAWLRFLPRHHSCRIGADIFGTDSLFD
jgi:hypothetical protein